MKYIGDPLMYPYWKAERKIIRKRKYKNILLKLLEMVKGQIS